MMKNDVAVGKNRTGVELHPAEKKGVLEVAEMTIPSMEGDESVLADARSEFASEGERIGTMPPPPSVKGAASQVVDAMKGANATVFLDKLGERLAFERTGTRLYEALIAKHASSEPMPGVPSLADLESIHRDELEHSELLRPAMLSLGVASATLQVYAGEHFVSDVLVGAGIGAGVGLLVPLAHPRDKRVTISPLFGSRQAGLAISGRF